MTLERFSLAIYGLAFCTAAPHHVSFWQGAQYIYHNPMVPYEDNGDSEPATDTGKYWT